MVAPLTSTSYDVDLFNSAYDNISLIANKVWAFNNCDDDSYRKLNQNLWIKICKLKQNHVIVKGKTAMLVSDVIPNSRLSQYGNYLYNGERESLYTRDNNKSNNAESKEPWLHYNINKKDFATFKGNQSLRSKEALSSVEVNDSEFGMVNEEQYENYCWLPYSINSIPELQLKKRISHYSILNIWRKSNIEYMVNHHGADKEPKTYLNYRKAHGEAMATCNLQQPTVILPKDRYREDKCKCSAKVAGPILSAEVPEFFPKKSCKENHCKSIPLQYFPTNANRICNRIAAAIPLSSVQTTLQNVECIPLMASPMIRPAQLLPPSTSPLQIQVPVHTLASPIQSICPIIQNPIQLHEKIIQPNQINPSVITGYHGTSAEQFQQCKKKHQRVDVQNCLLLTKTGMRTRNRCLSRNSEQCNLALEQSQINYRTDNHVHQWLNKAYGRPVKDFIASTFTESDLRNTQTKLHPCEMNKFNSSKQDSDN